MPLLYAEGAIVGAADDMVGVVVVALSTKAGIAVTDEVLPFIRAIGMSMCS